MDHDEKKMYNFAYTLTQTAGIKLKLERKNSTIKIKEKTSQMDIVTEQDILIEKYLACAILEKYSDHNILAEECHKDGCKNKKGYVWIIDPIDGTVNYYRFARDYAVSLALYRDGRPVFGLVYDVENDIMYSGRSKLDSAANGRKLDKLHVKKESLKKAVVSMSIRTMKELSSMGMDVFGMLSGVQAHRYLGCASLELCRVANGEYDMFISSNVYEWDIAAARILIEQCGGTIISCEKTGKAGKLFAAAFHSPKLWKEALKYLPDVWPSHLL